MILTSFRLILYIFSFTNIFAQEIYLYLNRLMYFTSLWWFYTFILFLYFFKNKFTITKIYFNILFLFSSFLLIVFTSYFISWINNVNGLYYETYWSYYILLFIFYYILYLYIPFLSYKTIKSTKLINKMRLKYIVSGYLIFVYLIQIFQLLLPLFWFYFLEKESIIFVIPLIIFSYYSTSRYSFSDISFRFKEIFSLFLSIISTILLLIFIKKISFLFWWDFLNFWWITNSFTYIDLIFSIITFYLLYNFFSIFIPWNKNYIKLLEDISKLQNEIRFILDFKVLKKYLDKKIYNNYWIKYTKLILFNDKNKDLELFNFFSNNLNWYFINDIVFLEENKNKFDLSKIKSQINKKSYIIFPLRNNIWELIWFFELWKKMYLENYYSEEIDIIKWFVNFLSSHLKYVEIYWNINYLNLNLDKEVDKKTIEFNNLINKQKEFISIASHEIKTPIMASSLQLESIIDDINDNDYSINSLKEELYILKEQIYKISDLSKVLFDIEKYDIWKINLYIERVKLELIFLQEIDFIKKINPILELDFIFDDSIWYVDLDKIQFTQVISNIINNANKFSNSINPKILIEVCQVGDFIKINIDDNWVWFQYNENESIFDKYNTWEWESIWLGLGLYLCKKITEYHWWKIRAYNSSFLSWASFEIIIPKSGKREI